jgi:hypothetical protein
VIPLCTSLFTAGYRSERQTAHQTQHQGKRPQPTTDDKG